MSDNTNQNTRGNRNSRGGRSRGRRGRGGATNNNRSQGQNVQEQANEEIVRTPPGHGPLAGMNSNIGGGREMHVRETHIIVPAGQAQTTFLSGFVQSMAFSSFTNPAHVNPKDYRMPTFQQAQAMLQRPIKTATGASKGTSKGTQKEKNTPAAPAEKKPDLHCKNCDQKGTHRLAQCVGPVGPDGFIPGCPFDGELDHIFEQCSGWDGTEEALTIMMCVRRTDRPQFKCSKAPTEHALTQEGQKFHGNVPWSTEFALDYQTKNPEYWKNYQYARNPKDDVPLASPGFEGFSQAKLDANKVDITGLVKVTTTRTVLPRQKRAREECGEGGDTGEQNPKRNKDASGDQFGSSPASKSKKTWSQHTSKISAIINSMVPDGLLDNTHQAYYQIARCFALTSALEKFKEYLASGNENWLCLSSALVVGVESTTTIDDINSTCEWCSGMVDRCVQVQLKMEVVRFRIVDIAE